MKRLAKILLGIAAVSALAVGAGAWVVVRQGVPDRFWESFPDATVRFDTWGIPTLEAPSWERLLTAEGYVVASERLWQMDLIRRKAGGRLAEWFGEAALAHDAAVQAEDRLALTRKAAESLPATERRDCEAYAAGVNRFIAEQKGRWGIEYVLLRAEPEVWTCADSLLVVIEMAETLTSSAETEARQWAWRRHLSPAWQNFLFPEQLPWNVPLFGATDHKPPPFPPAAEWLLKRPLDESAAVKTGALFEERPAIGSNSWAWRGKTGHYLANDPHLANAVPGIWYAVRLKVARGDWAVGMAIPGLPGIVIGMNPALAWSFTNTGEDVDDYLEEHLSPDGALYEQRPGNWVPVIHKSFLISVKGEAIPRKIEALFTERGPLAKRKYLGDGFYARQWLALQHDALRLPALPMMHAQTLAALDQAVEGLRIPAQNVVAMDRQGTIRYQTSGTGPIRRRAGNVPLPAFEGVWLGFEPQSQRRRLEKPSNTDATAFLSTANQRIWSDGFGGHNWTQDDRNDRLQTLLAARDDFTRREMEAMHHDTVGRFRRQLLEWVALRAGPVPAWRGWDGNSRSNPRAFTEAGVVEEELTNLLIGRVREAFLRNEPDDATYIAANRRAWILAVLAAPGDEGLTPFGLTASEVAQHLLRTVLAQRPTMVLHPQSNKWGGQHPFVGRVPIIGSLFAVTEFEQWGAIDLVAAERAGNGPSVRVVWDMSRPWDSTWSFPVGQSGHVANRHYRDFQAIWMANQTVPVFADGETNWEFHGQHK